MEKLEDREMKLYIQTLNTIEDAVIDDNLDSFKVSCSLVNHVITQTLDSKMAEKYQERAYTTLGSINLICLACKSAATNVLKYLLSNEVIICSLKNLIDKSNLLPEEKDDEGHNAIYYAIRSNKTEILEILAKNWLEDCFKENSDRLDDLLSEAFKDLMIRNVYVCENMKMHVKRKLVDLRFYNEPPPKKKAGTKNPKIQLDTKNLKDLLILRIDFVLKNIKYLRKRFWNKKPNEQFLLSSKYIAKNILMVESSMICMDRLPWKEINFCLSIFIRSCESCFRQYPLYHLVLNKHKLLKHLTKFSKILNVLKNEVSSASLNKHGGLLFKKINGIESMVNFKKLYDDFTQIRDLYSLEKIKSCIDLAMSANIVEKCDQLVIVRSLQIIGECMKNTEESPNLSEDTYRLLLSSLPDNLKVIVSKLRDRLSHDKSLSVRSSIEMREQNFFKRIQSDITEMNAAITDLISRKKAKIIGKLLSKIKNYKDMETLNIFLKHNPLSAISLQKELIEIQNLNLGSTEQLKNLVLELEREVKNQINEAMKLFVRIQDMVHSIRIENQPHTRHSPEFKSYMPVDPKEFLQTYSDFCSVTSVSLQTKIESTNQGVALKTAFNMPKNVEKHCKILINICEKYGLITLMRFFKKVNDFLDYSDISQNIPVLQSLIDAISIKEEEITQFESLINNLKDSCNQRTNRVEEMFQIVHSLIENEKTNSKHTQNTFNDYLKKLITVIQFNNKECSHVFETPLLDFQETFESLTLVPFSKKFSKAFQDITSELVRDNVARGINFLTTLGKIQMFLEFRLGKIQWIKELNQLLESQEKNKPLRSLDKGPNLNSKMEDLLPSKLFLLKEIISDYHANKLLFEKSQHSQQKLKLESIIEMITLDSMTILGNRLTHNAFFLDCDYPVVNGKNLRNHLAHGNALFNFVLGCDSTDILLNAEKMATCNQLTKNNLTTDKNDKPDKQIGKKIKNDPERMKHGFHKDLSAVNEQLNLFFALTEGKMEKVKECLRKGADMFGTDLYSRTSLHFAAKGPCLKIVKFVLRFNLGLSAVDIDFQTALHIASLNGRFAIVKFLIDKSKTLLDKRDLNGRTALHLASINGHADIVEHLLSHGAEMDSTDIFGNAALHYAIIRRHMDVANILLGKKTFFGVSALHLASEIGHKSLITTLLENIGSSLNFVSLHYAARGGHVDIVRLLIKEGADVNARNFHENTPLHMAAEKGHKAVVGKLLQYGADVNDRNLHGNTPLHIAAEKGHKEVVEILLQHGADINSYNLNGLTALSFAVKGGFTDISKTILEKEIAVKTSFWSPLNLINKITSYFLIKLKLLLGKGSNSYSPIILAAKFGHYELVGMLFQNCDISSKVAALHWAALKGHLSVVELLVSKGISAECENNGFTALHFAACEGHSHVVDFLISKGYDKKVNSKIIRKELEKNSNHQVQDSCRTAILFISCTTDSDAVSKFPGTTALHLSAFGKHKEIVRTLLKAEADINIKDEIGITPLQSIIANGMAHILIEEKISINLSKYDDFGPLLLGATIGDLCFVKYCLKKCFPKDAESDAMVLDAKNKALAVATSFGHGKIVNYLINVGANINAKSSDGFTPLDLAVESKRKEIVHILVDNEDLELSSENERKYLLSSIRSGHEDLVEYFLSRDPSTSSSMPECNVFPLHTAVQYGHLQIVKKLVASGKREDINDENETAATPLQLASGQGYCEITRLLLSNGADPNRPEHSPPLVLAVENEDYEMIEILIQAEASVTHRNKQGYSAIDTAMKNKSPRILERLLELSKIDINLKDCEGISTILHQAVGTGSLEIVKLLVEKGVDVHGKDSSGAKPIHVAARGGHQDIVEYFLNKGLHIDDRGENGWSLLHYSAAGNQSEICEFFLKKGLNVNAVDGHGCTPLHIAAQTASADVLNILLHCGAYYDICNKRNETPLEIVMSPIIESTSKYPIIACLVFIRSLFTAVQKNDLHKVKASLDEGLKFSIFGFANIKNAENFSPIDYAVKNGYEEMVNLLLKYNAIPNETRY